MGSQYLLRFALAALILCSAVLTISYAQSMQVTYGVCTSPCTQQITLYTSGSGATQPPSGPLAYITIVGSASSCPALPSSITASCSGYYNDFSMATTPCIVQSFSSSASSYSSTIGSLSSSTTTQANVCGYYYTNSWQSVFFPVTINPSSGPALNPSINPNPSTSGQSVSFSMTCGSCSQSEIVALPPLGLTVKGMVCSHQFPLNP